MPPKEIPQKEVRIKDRKEEDGEYGKLEMATGGEELDVEQASQLEGMMMSGTEFYDEDLEKYYDEDEIAKMEEGTPISKGPNLRSRKGRKELEPAEMLMEMKEELDRQRHEFAKYKREMTTTLRQREKKAAVRQEQEMADLKRNEQEQGELLVSLTEQCKRQKEEIERLKKNPGENRIPAKVSVSKFSGTEDLEDYLMQFEAVAKLQQLNEENKAIVLLSKLEGSALATVNTSKTKSYQDMVTCLKENFSPEQRELSYQKLQTRQQKKGETFSILAAEIQKLTMKSYPQLDALGRDIIATGHFVNSISNSMVRQKLREKHPKDLSTAIKEARQIQADQETETMLTKRGERVHMVDETEFEELRERVCELQNSMSTQSSTRTENKQHSNGKEQKDSSKLRFKRKGPPTCYHCGYKGHVQRWCPSLMGSNKNDAVNVQSRTSNQPNQSEKEKQQENLKG